MVAEGSPLFQHVIWVLLTPCTERVYAHSFWTWRSTTALSIAFKAQRDAIRRVHRPVQRFWSYYLCFVQAHTQRCIKYQFLLRFQLSDMLLKTTNKTTKSTLMMQRSGKLRAKGLLKWMDASQWYAWQQQQQKDKKSTQTCPEVFIMMLSLWRSPMPRT